jgi:foldase protein PrsA
MRAKTLLQLLLLPALVTSIILGCSNSQKKEAKNEEKPAKEEKTTSQTKERTTSEVKEEGKTVVAYVNGRPIYKEDLRGRSLQDAIDLEILYEEGLRRGLDKELEDKIENFKKRLIVTTLQREILKNVKVNPSEITDKEIEEYYNQNKDKYRYLVIKEIVTDDKSIAEEIQKRALQGEDFEKIASEYSQAGKNVTVRDVRNPRKYSKVFSGNEIGSISQIIQEGNEFKILKLVNVREIPLSRAKQAIKYNLVARKKADAIHEFAEKVKKEHNIKVEILENPEEGE